ncbi:MAG: endonuclease III domain-containing protein [Bacilli bacterium]|jgi:endonuclease-3
MKKKSKEVFLYLDKLYPKAKGELKYTKDYEFLIAVVLSAQTTDQMVNRVTEKLFQDYPTLEDLMMMEEAVLINYLTPLGLAKRKALYIKDIVKVLFNQYQGVVLNNREILESFKGVGRKTANLVLGELFQEPYLAVDTHIMRISKRLNLASKNDNPYQVEQKLMNLLPRSKVLKTHYQLILFGRYFCKAKKPLCKECQLKSICQYYLEDKE